jgi:hypothetical protein
MTLVMVLLCACGDPAPGGADDSTVAVDDSGADDSGVDDTGGAKTDAGWDDDVFSVSGTLTWTIDFADDSLDCSYTRTYTGTEDRSEPWTCPDCAVQFEVAVAFDGIDCYQSLGTGAEPSAVEYIGMATDGSFHRASSVNFPMVEQGTASVDGDTIAIHNEDTPDDQSYTLTVDGTLERAHSDADPMDGWVSPESYACGWPTSDLPPYDGPWTITGDALPDGWFIDTCDEPVRLHDFAGSYLVIDIAATDCGPCQGMATDAPAFEEDMAAQGLTVFGITLLAPSLDAILEDTPTGTLEAWANTFDVSGPVLGDRGWGYAVLGEYIGVDNFAYPTWAVVSPDLEVLSVGTGYGTGTWDEIAATIENDHG